MMEAQMPGKQQDRVKRDLRESGKTGDHKMGQLQTPLRGGGGRGVALHRGSILASHPSALGLIISVPQKII